MSFFKNYQTALSFLTICRLTPAEDDDVCFEDAHLAFPWVGLTIGIFAAVLSILTMPIGAHLSSAILLIFLAVISGGLHLDGLADSFDGLLSHRSKEQVLEILKDPRLGTMGACGLFGNLLLKYAALVQLHENGWLLVSTLVFAPFWGRWCLRCGMIALPYARQEGLGAHFWNREKQGFLGVTLIGVALSCCCWGWMTPFVFCVSAILPYWLFSLAQDKIDGGTGDILGAGCEMTETSVLVAVAILVL